ncbi:MAG: hypothetical protein QMD50_00205 [Patescibacteria group bacterium]|nr:hypothetical protein [Patescibacteria group bacterium]
MKKIFLKNILFTFGIALIALLAFANFSLAFLGPTNPAGVGSGLLMASSSGALVVTTSTFSTNQSQFLIKTVVPNQWLFFSSNGNIGISTSSPTYTLDVNGEIRATTFRGNGSNLTDLRPSGMVGGVFGGGANYAFPVGLSVGTSTVVGIPDIFHVVGRAEIYNPSDTGRLTIKGMNMSSSTDPDSAELILKDSKSGQTWNLENRGTADNEFRLESWDQITWRVPFKVASTSPTNSLVIASSGYVGIGTNLPSYKLDVVGDANVSGSYRRGGTAGISISCPSGQVLATTTVTGGIITGGSCAALGGGSLTGSGISSQVAFFTNVTTLSSDSNLYWDNTNKRLGIGTSPSSTLHVKDRIRLDGLTNNYPSFLGYTNSATSWHAFYQIMYRSRGTLSAPLAAASGDSISTFDNFIYDGSAYIRGAQLATVVDGTVSTNIVPTRWAFSTMDTAGSYTTRMTIKNTGNVGIGTPAPTQKLEVQGGDLIVRKDSSWDAGDVSTIYLGATDTSYWKNIYGTGTEFYFNDNVYFNKVNYAADKFYFQVGGVNKVTIDNDGKVGIGTTAPSSTLHMINGTSTTTLSIGSSASGANRGRVCQWNGANYTLTSFAANSITPIYSTSTTCL